MSQASATTGNRGLTASLLAVLLSAGAWAIDWLVLTNGLPKADGNSHDAVIMIITAWNGLALAVCGYFFGNSANSDRKTELLATSTPPQATSTTVTPGKTTTESTPAPTVTPPTP